MDTPIAMHSVLNERTRKNIIVHILSLITRLSNFYKGIHRNNNCHYSFIRLKISLKSPTFVKLMHGTI